MRLPAGSQLHLFRRKNAPLPAAHPTEFRLACAFADTLRQLARRDWRWSHFPSGEWRETVTGERLKRQGLHRGWPDYLFISPEGQLHCLELKRRKLGRLTDEQAAFGAWCKAHGVPWRVARTYDEAIAAVTEWGVLRLEVNPQ